MEKRYRGAHGNLRLKWSRLACDYLIQKLELNWEKLGKIRVANLIDWFFNPENQFLQFTECLADGSNKMKNEILKIAKEEYRNIDEIISTCGEIYPTEFFAEVFAYMECSDTPNFIGKAIANYINNWFE
ncbi:MAG: hypothetical protein RsTaC01_0751 [Candidatus Paraimprobicoccus trichonymphae]|uniref:Uncharacterized protein n=1 Tax=Candidatus Paraimprobicoccus trichonymphae TaxID=3033793 RepID=A0AA48HZZ6_9FIRM|nr:MAG: hypothetical protein RsTaC01_0751 [Candidatus Paraimprobicoccus trichonymphae]